MTIEKTNKVLDIIFLSVYSIGLMFTLIMILVYKDDKIEQIINVDTAVVIILILLTIVKWKIKK